MDSVIVAKGLVKKYKKFTLGPVDLEIPKGFSTALIGANGAGKTTLLDTICGIMLDMGFIYLLFQGFSLFYSHHQRIVLL